MKNIMMNAEMAKAILDGRKTQTRRTIKQSEAGNIKDNPYPFVYEFDVFNGNGTQKQ